MDSTSGQRVGPAAHGTTTGVPLAMAARVAPRAALAAACGAALLFCSARPASAQADPPAAPPGPAADAVELQVSPPPDSVVIDAHSTAPATSAPPAGPVEQPTKGQPLAPPAPAATPTAAPGPSVPIRPYGILWSSMLATQPVQSFGFANASAPTSAVNPAAYAHPHDGLLSFQVQQTRAGIVVGEGTPFRGTLEIDFIHFDQASPLAQAYPRIRIALLEWKFTDNQKLFAGQTWDIFGNATGPQLLSHSFNLVGTLFQAGNIGFMRQQFGWAGTFDDLEFAAAVGLQGANTGPTFNNIEESGAPTGSGRVMYHLPGTLGVFGVSGIGTALRFTQGATIQHRAAGGTELFADLTFGALNVHSEVYFSQNLANTGALNLAQGRFGVDLRDVGGYLSGRLTLGKHAFTAMYGVAGVLNPGDLAPGYSPASMMGTTSVAATLTPTAGPGMRYNMSGHVGYWYSPLKGLSIVLEPYVYATRFKLAPADAGRFDSKNVSWGGMLGSMYQF